MKRVKRLNVQGLARKAPEIMKHILPEDGCVLVSIDLSAGEPTITTEFSKDPNYRYATFDGIGKVPHYQDGVLMIDDLYLMVASVNPVTADDMREAFPMIRDSWLADPELVKKKLDRIRKLNKMGALALGYGMGPKKMVRQFNDAGFRIDMKQAQGFFNAYWLLFKCIKKFGERLQRQVEIDGYIVNPFGYRLVPEKIKAFNYFIQSSVSGQMAVFNIKLLAAAPYCRLLTIIHDELLVEVPESRLEEFKLAKELATKSLNDDLAWSVDVRTGFAVGVDWYTAK